MEEILKALELKKQLDSLRPINKEQEAKIMQKFRLDWNYHSNNLEGNSLTYGETKALLLFNITAQGKPLKDHFEITGHNEAINWVIEVVNGDRPLTESFIRELHTLLLKESYEVDAITPDGQPTKKRVNVGSYKSTPNHVKTKTGEIFYFATPEETPAEMAALMQWYNEKIEEPEVNPILLAAEFHYKFIRIHPFDDGNGRAARILMNFILMKFGYPPVIIKTEDKANYFAALQLADAGNIEAFIDYISKNLNRSLEIMIAGAQGEDIEEQDDIDKEIALLEKKLATFGKKIEKEKTEESVADIYRNSVYPFVTTLISKFKAFKDYFLYSNIYIQLNGNQFNNSAIPESINYIVNEIRIGVVNSQFKKEGFENYSFHYDINFEFNTLNYTVWRERQKIIFAKNYENLSPKEIEYLIKDAVRNYIDDLEQLMSMK